MVRPPPLPLILVLVVDRLEAELLDTTLSFLSFVLFNARLFLALLNALEDIYININ